MNCFVSWTVNAMFKPKNRLYVVYKHTNRTNGKVYIGITCQATEKRWQKGAGYAGTYFGNAIKKYGWDAFTHEVIETGLEEKQACERERALISEYRSNEREYGYNLSGGGEVTDCIVPMIGEDNPKAVAVIRIDSVTGEKKTFPSVDDASREMGINHRGICKACRGVAKTYMGYVWEYADVQFKKPDRPTRGNYPHTKIMKRVRVEENGNITEYGSIKEAAYAYGLRGASVSRYISGSRKDNTGRVWSFV